MAEIQNLIDEAEGYVESIVADGGVEQAEGFKRVRLRGAPPRARPLAPAGSQALVVPELADVAMPQPGSPDPGGPGEVAGRALGFQGINAGEQQRDALLQEVLQLKSAFENFRVQDHSDDRQRRELRSMAILCRPDKQKRIRNLWSVTVHARATPRGRCAGRWGEQAQREGPTI